MKFLIINGPNINMLGIREKNIYGEESYPSLLKLVEDTCAKLGIQCECFQSNHEGDIVDAIQNAYGRVDGIVINPAAYTHTSIAILDATQGSQHSGGGSPYLGCLSKGILSACFLPCNGVHQKLYRPWAERLLRGHSLPQRASGKRK